MRRLAVLMAAYLLVGCRVIAQDPLPIQSVSATGKFIGYPTAAAIDGNLGTTWQVQVPQGSSRQYTVALPSIQYLDNVSIAFWAGSSRQTTLTVEVSNTGEPGTWQTVLTGIKSLKTDNFQRFTFNKTTGRYMRFTSTGTDKDRFFAMREIRIDVASNQNYVLGGIGGNTGGGTEEPAPVVDQFALSWPAQPTVRYIDCNSTATTRDGTTPQKAFKTLTEAKNGITITAGLSIYFRRGCTWEGRWGFTSTAPTAALPLVLAAYGQGERPVIKNNSRAGNASEAFRFDGTSNVIMNNLILGQTAENIPGPYVVPTGSTPYNKPGVVWEQDCSNPTGFIVGVGIYSAAKNIRLDSIKVTHSTYGVHIGSSSGGFVTIVNSQFVDNFVMSKNTPTVHYTNDPNGNGNVFDDLFNNSQSQSNYDDDVGAIAITLNQNDNEVAYNYFNNNASICSEDYGTEGADLEIFGSSRNYFHHNTSIGSGTFSESGGTAADNIYAYNLFYPNTPLSQKSAEILVLRTGGRFGGGARAQFYNNTAINVQVGITCSDGCGSAGLTARNNVVVGAAVARKKDGYSCKLFGGCGNNDQKAEYFADGEDIDGNGTKDNWPVSSNNRIGRFSPTATSGTSNTGQWSCGSGQALSNCKSSTDLNLTLTQISNLFVNATGLDFRPSASSALRNAGTANALTFDWTRSTGVVPITITTDLNGKPVPTPGRGVDIGAIQGE